MPLQRSTLLLELGEARDHLNDMLAAIKSGDFDPENDIALSMNIAHVMEHLNRAWHSRERTADEHAALAQEEFERISAIIPNHQLQFDLRPHYES